MLIFGLGHVGAGFAPNEGGGRNMLTYLDVTGTDREHSAIHAPSILAHAKALGFERVGTMGVFTGSKTHEINPVLSNGHMFLEVCPHPKRKSEPILQLHSILDDGSVVETATFSPRRNHPGAGYHLEVHKDATLGLLLQTHFSRVRELSSQRGSMIRKHESVAQMVWVSKRNSNLTMLRSLPMIIGSPILGTAAALIATSFPEGWFSSFNEGMVFGIGLSAVGVLTLLPLSRALLTRVPVPRALINPPGP